MKNTGERVIPEFYRSNPEDYLIFLMHVRSYDLILNEVKEKTVLDFGCGDGYGAKILSQYAKHVIAVDIEQEAIISAEKKYHSNNINYKHIRATEQVSSFFGQNYFDVVISYQVIEHVDNVAAYLNQIHTVLKPNGNFFLTTPNAGVRLLPFQNPWNKFHIREYDLNSFYSVLKKEFANVEIKGLTYPQKFFRMEMRRINRNKWILWPFTNKIIPESLRKTFLSMIKKAIPRAPKKESSDSLLPPSDDKKNIFVTKEDVNKCPNFFAICSK